MIPITEIFCLIDDSYKIFNEKTKTKYLLNPNRKRLRPCQMSLSEIMTIVVMFHLSHYRTFKDFYLHCLLIQYRKEFPNLVSYNRFLELMPLTSMPLFVFNGLFLEKKRISTSLILQNWMYVIIWEFPLTKCLRALQKEEKHQ